MKTATVRDFKNRYTTVLRWVSAGEEVLITRRGVVIAKLSPAPPKTGYVVGWASSPEVLRDRSSDEVMSAEQSSESWLRQAENGNCLRYQFPLFALWKRYSQPKSGGLGCAKHTGTLPE